MYLAIQSQPPGSIQGKLRVTEQGEMVQAKFGTGKIALRQMEIVTTAVLRAGLSPGVVEQNKYREIMDKLSKISCDMYRKIVFETPVFLSYFKKATPEAEIENLNIGSRPARRKKGSSSVKDLRAIPWIFAWTQNRLVLPAWLGKSSHPPPTHSLNHLAHSLICLITCSRISQVLARPLPS